MNLTSFDRFFIIHAVGKCSGSVQQVRTGLSVMAKLDFSDEEKTSMQYDELGFPQVLPNALSAQPAKDFDLSEVEKNLVKLGLGALTILPIEKRSGELLDKFGV